jgi:hypothetical protein
VSLSAIVRQKEKDDIKGTLKNQSLTFMFLGFSVNHKNDVYRKLNLNPKRIIQKRDDVWPGKFYNDWQKNKNSLNDNDKDEDIGNSMKEYVTFITKVSIIEKNQITQEEKQKICAMLRGQSQFTIVSILDYF